MLSLCTVNLSRLSLWLKRVETGRAFQAHKGEVSFEYRIRWHAREARDPTRGTGAALPF